MRALSNRVPGAPNGRVPGDGSVPVLLDRLRIRGKLALLVAPPLVILTILAGFVAVDRANRASLAARTVRSVSIASQVGSVVARLQQERLVSVGVLLKTTDTASLALATASVDDRIVDVEGDLGTSLPSQVRAALDGARNLAALRTSIVSGTVRPDDVISVFGSTIAAIIDSLRLVDGIDATTVAGREVLALDALIRIDELNSRAAALLVDAAGTKTPQSIVAYAASRAAVDATLSQFTNYATAEQIALYGLVTNAFIDRTGLGFDTAFTTNPQAAMARQSASTLYPELTSFVVLGRFVETKIATDVAAAVTSQERADLVTAYGTGGLSGLVVILIALRSIAVARSVARPLTQLTLSANRVAGLAARELERVADDESDIGPPIHLDPVYVTATDEVGDLARAFERVRGTATQLVERQVTIRRNVAQMFGHVGRRTQNLVGRQIALIDSLEYEEADPARLQDLYRLDHVASRLRRNASSLVVLSGAADDGGHFAPLPLADVARLALGEIESYTRVDIAIPDGTSVAPGVINDLVLMLAELMENATAFSPPHTRVSVTTAPRDPRLSIVDHGIGLSPERLAEENARLAQRERLDLAPTEVLGLFVVGRLARRHGIEVKLSPTSGGGITVQIDLAEHVIATTRSTTARAIERGPRGPETPARTVRAVAAVAQRPGESLADTAPESWYATERNEPVRIDAYRTDAAHDEVLEVSAGDPPFDVEELDRATRVLEASSPWNAFELPQPALPSTPYRLEPQVSEPQLGESQLGESQVGESQPGEPQRVRPEMARPVPVTPLPGSGSGLTRRIPGATTRNAPPMTPVRPHLPQDPSMARELIEQFEFGVARALREVRPDHRDEEGS